MDEGALAEVLREEGGDEAEALKEAAKEAGLPLVIIAHTDPAQAHQTQQHIQLG